MDIFERIRNKKMRELVVEPEEAAKLIKNGMTVAFSGFTAAGYPKSIPAALIERVNQGEEIKLTLITGASVGPEVDDAMAKAGLIARRIPYQTSSPLRKAINNRECSYVEIQLEKLSKVIQKGWLGSIDVAVIEALAINEEGYLIPTTSVGIIPILAKVAKQIIVEVNTAQPEGLEGMHDIYLPSFINQDPIPLKYVNQRIGENFVRVDPDKIKYIVKSEAPDTPDKFVNNDPAARKIAQNLFNFLELEIQQGRLPKELRPIQSGIGNIANSVVSGFIDSNFKNLQFYCGVLQEGILELFDQGKVLYASGGALAPTAKVLSSIAKDARKYKDNIILRPVEISNNVEVINRLGIIALNNALEMDIYGNVNTSHLMGSQVMNGIGGGVAFCANAYLSVMMMPSTSRNGDISNFVPMVSHCDIAVHDIDIVISDVGIADLRGKDPVERAQAIIANCVDPEYRELLLAYLKKAISQTGGHKPILLEDALSWHLRYQNNKSMKKGV